MLSADSNSNVTFRNVDLKLPSNKDPLDLAGWKVKNGESATIEALYSQGPKIYAVGSSDMSTLCYKRELGMFECVKEVWANHWNLRTSPEDWWFPVACRIAKAIHKAAKSGSKQVREKFVDHEGKKEIKIELPVYDIYGIEYEGLFSIFSSEIRRRIKCPAFATCMQNDFSTTTASQKIAGEINLMAGMQEFFSYHVGMEGCGIKAVEMQGTQEDWEHLLVKFQQIRKELEPFARKLYLYEDWFDHVELVFRNLAKTYSSKDDPVVAKFWADILMHSKAWQYGSSGFGDGCEVNAYNGWLIKFLLGQEHLHKIDLHDDETQKKLKTVNSVPMRLTFEYRDPIVSEESELVAGIAGYELVTPEKTFNAVPSLKPCHMWAMLVPPKSPLLEHYIPN